jgi:ferredoxin-NADP reductase
LVFGILPSTAKHIMPQDALEEIDDFGFGGGHEGQQTPRTNARRSTRPSSPERPAALLDPEPLMRAAAELLAEHASLLSKRAGATDAQNEH